MKRFFKWVCGTGEGKLLVAGVIVVMLLAAGLIALNKGYIPGPESGDAPEAATPETIDMTDLRDLVIDGEVTSLEIGDGFITSETEDGQVKAFAWTLDPLDSLTGLSDSDGKLERALAELGIRADITPEPTNWGSVVMTILPLVGIGVLVFLMVKRSGAGGGVSQQAEFGKSRARMHAGDKPVITFADVAGVEEAKEELQEVVEFLSDPDRFTAMGARIPRGILMVGAPGTGKTLMAKAVSGEAGVTFFSISGSEFVEMFVGVGASRVRDLFDQAKRNSPCIVFVDEIDAAGRRRGGFGSHDEKEQTLNQILVEMDGFDTDTNVIVLAATNRPDMLDPALTRPGRFDRRVVVGRPDMKGRKAILEVHTRGKPLASDVDLMALAKQIPGLVGADIENLVNEAAILAARLGKTTIGMTEFDEAIMRVLAGPKRKSCLISDEEKEIIAYHEAGHALVMKGLPRCDSVAKVTIMPRGGSLGSTWNPPTKESYIERDDEFRDEMASLLGGRVAVKRVFGFLTAGAKNDLERATAIARKMVTELGMSKRLGHVTFSNGSGSTFLGADSDLSGRRRDYSEQVARQIDEEVRALVDEAHKRAEKILRKHERALHAVAKRLLEVETIGGDEFRAIVAANS
jgi:cell division protease FtsH